MSRIEIKTTKKFDKITMKHDDSGSHYSYSFNKDYSALVFEDISLRIKKEIKVRKILLRPLVIFDVYIKLDTLNIKRENLFINGIKGLAIDSQIYSCLKLPVTEEEKMYELTIMKTAFDAIKKQIPIVQSDDDNIVYGLQLLDDLFACGGIQVKK